MATNRAGLFDDEFDKRSMFDPEMHPDGIFDAQFAEAAAVAAVDNFDWLKVHPAPSPAQHRHKWIQVP